MVIPQTGSFSFTAGASVAVLPAFGPLSAEALVPEYMWRVFIASRHLAGIDARAHARDGKPSAVEHRQFSGIRSIGHEDNYVLELG